MLTHTTLRSNTDLHRVAVVGDIGGHLGFFRQLLDGLGVSDTTIPDGLTVVQVGDLVHKGPDSAGCVQLADQLLQTNPGRYIQLWGNHEAHYLGGPDVSDRRGVRPISLRTQQVLRRWWHNGTAQLAAAFDTGQVGPTLITHGGLTAGMWQELGAPTDVHETAEAVNRLLDDPVRAWRPGKLMTGHTNLAAGPICPRTGAELAQSWLNENSMPFSQMHGHEGVWWWPDNDWHTDVPEPVKALSRVDHERRFSTVHLHHRRLWSIDWCLGMQVPEFTPEPAVLYLPGTQPNT